MGKTKPLTKQEQKILVYTKMKIKGLSYDEAWKEVKKDIAFCKKTANGTKR